MNLKHYAAHWLKWEKNCPLVMFERSPRTWHAGQPDVIGITKSRHMLEIEIKISMSDFRANARKRHIEMRNNPDPVIAEKYLRMAPKQFWFMVPRKMLDSALREVPDYAGLMTPNDCGNKIEIIKPSPSNAKSERLSLKECSMLMRNAGNQIMSMMMEGQWRKTNGITAMDCTEMDDYFSEVGSWMPEKLKTERESYLNFQV